MRYKSTLKLALGFILIIITNFSCREKELRDIELQEKPLHCFNNRKDFDESIIDGGGSCGCNKININGNCSLASNEIQIDNKTFSIKEIRRDTVNDEIVIVNYIFNTDDELYIKYHKNILFNTVLSFNSSNMDNQSIYISILYKKYSKYNQSLESKNYMLLNNGCNANLVSCDAAFYSSFKITCKLNLKYIF